MIALAARLAALSLANIAFWIAGCEREDAPPSLSRLGSDSASAARLGLWGGSTSGASTGRRRADPTRAGRDALVRADGEPGRGPGSVPAVVYATRTARKRACPLIMRA